MFSKVAFLTLGLFVAGVVSAESIRVTLLGSGSPNPSPDQFGPSTLVAYSTPNLPLIP